MLKYIHIVCDLFFFILFITYDNYLMSIIALLLLLSELISLIKEKVRQNKFKNNGNI